MKIPDSLSDFVRFFFLGGEGGRGVGNMAKS